MAAGRKNYLRCDGRIEWMNEWKGRRGGKKAQWKLREGGAAKETEMVAQAWKDYEGEHDEF